MTTAPADVVKSLAPTGTLRAAINIANPVLVQRNPVTGAPMRASPSISRASSSGGSACRWSRSSSTAPANRSTR